ncbi:sialate O-acetylesterase [Coraliomargarita sp. SDUM461004]|uniref:Sialate O-acetylesterase n=1 Tax=Thalassobacterium sedimentorum TaxID=3041258 RepID=A0ABU1AFT4_9BACT|nr:sialate O-acetylesterase [Coraliomargarita sp. SDUM461004]
MFVFLFGGQSNALGWGYKQYLIDNDIPLVEPRKDVDLYYTIVREAGYLPTNQLVPLQPGASHQYQKLGGFYPELKEPVCRFGPELSMATVFRERMTNPEDKLCVVKFARGGASLYDASEWRPDGSADSKDDGQLYQIFQNTVSGAMTALEQKYPEHQIVVIGMGWVQGEADAMKSKGDEYETHLTRFIEDIRNTYGNQVGFAFSQVSPHQYMHSKDRARMEQWKMVADAQRRVAASMSGVYMTETAGVDYAVSRNTSEGGVHFTTPALLQIGRDLGNSIADHCGLSAGNVAVVSGEPVWWEQEEVVISPQADPNTYAVIRVKDGEVDNFIAGTEVFLNRDYVLNESPPAMVEGLPFVRTRIDGISFSVVEDGKLYVLTPLAQHVSLSQASKLESSGFRIVSGVSNSPLWGDLRIDHAVIYEKMVQSGESYTFGKWAIVVGASLENVN